MRHKFVGALLLLLAALSAACSSDPEKLKREYVTSGDQFVAQKKYPEAIIEFRNAVAQDARFGEARLKLASALEATGNAAGALGEYVRAADLMPDDVRVQLATGQRLLLAGQYPEARARADAILAKDPRDVTGLILMGNALAGLKDFAGAISQMEQAIETDPNGTLWYANLGLLQMAKGDTTAAENVLKRAVQVQPKSAAARWSLGNYYLAAGRPSDAEAELKTALELEPNSLVVLRALAMFYANSGRNSDAESYLKKYVDVAPNPASKLLLADFYIRAGKSTEATTLLRSIADEKELHIPATLRLAGMDYDAGNRNKAYEAVDAILRSEPTSESALLVKARLLTNDKKPAEVLAIANKVLDRNPRSASGLFLKAAALEATGARGEAIQTLQGLLAENPSNVLAQLKLAELYLVQQNLNDAVQLATQVLKAQPQSAEAHLIMANVSIRQGNFARAESELGVVAETNPNSADVHNAFGNLYWRRGNVARARASYARALELQPTSIVALTGLVQADVSEKKPDAARARIRARLDASPDDPTLWFLAGSTFSAIGDVRQAEAAFNKAIEVDPTNLAAYNSLGAVYMSQNRLEEAKKNYADVARRQQKPVAATTMVGMILTLQNKPDEARNQYERALSIDPRAAVAANNLAWDYAERGGNLDVALQLAQTAKSQLPNNAEVSDTLGWIYYRKGLANLAITALQAGVDQDRSNPMIHYHLGLAYAKSGNRLEAQRSLEQALRLNPQFAGADDAKRVLGTLKG